MAGKKIIAQPKDLAVAEAIAIYFNELPNVNHSKILSTPNSIAFYLHQSPWAQHLFSILTQKHADSAFRIFTEILVELGFAESK